MFKKATIVLLLGLLPLLAWGDFLDGVKAEDLMLDRIEAVPAQIASEVEKEGFDYWLGKVSFTAHSPDGLMLAELVIERSRSYGLRLIDTQTKQEELIVEGNVQNIRWSPDSRYTAFYMLTPTNGHTSVYDVKQRNMQSVPFGSNFEWSSQGSYLAGKYIDTAGSWVLAIYNAMDKNTKIIDRIMFCEPWNFSWSPNGEMLVYTVASKTSGCIETSPIRSDVFVINRDGTGKTQITNTPEPEILVKWLADGGNILVERFEEMPDTIYGGGEKELVILKLKLRESR